MIRSNYDEFSARAKSGECKPITAFEVQKLAIEEEYKIFTNNKVVTMYRRGMAYLMANIKSKTDKWEAHEIIKDWLETPEAGKMNGFKMTDWVTTPKSQEKKEEPKTSTFQGIEMLIILREINFGNFRSAKSAILTHFEVLKFSFFCIFLLSEG